MNWYLNWITGTALGLSLSLGAYAAPTKTAAEPSKEEALFVRRIIEFWKDKETSQVKQQIHQFLENYPNSSYRDSLFVVLGDTYWNEHAYEQALAAYHSITSSKFQERVVNNLIDSLYRLGRWKQVEQLLKDKVTSGSASSTPEEQLYTFYHAEALHHLAQQEKESSKQQAKYAKSLKEYAKIQLGRYAISAKLAQADILAALNRPLEAAALYRELIGHIPDQKEKLLLQAGRLQALAAPQEAILTFSELQHLNGSTQAEASLYKAYLLFNQGNYQQLLQEESQLAEHLNQEQRPLLNYLIGRAHLALNQQEQAAHLLIPLLKGSNKPNSLINHRALLLTLLANAYQRNQLNDVVAWSEEFHASFPQDPLTPRVLYLQATAYKNCDHYAKAEKVLDRLLTEYPDFEKREGALFERNTLLYKQGLWNQCRKAACKFINAFPDSEWTPIMLQYIPSASVKMLEEAYASGEPTERLSKQLLKDIDLVLQVPGAVPEDQKSKYLLKKAKTLFDLQQYQETIAISDEILKAYPLDPQNYQVHLLAAMSHREGTKDMPRFAFHVEKALELNPRLQKSENLRVNLFSAYLALAQDRKETTGKSDGDLLTQTYVNQAAGHLLEALSLEDSLNHTLIRNENKLWLANHLYKKAQQFAPDEYWLEALHNPIALKEAQKAKIALEKVLLSDREGNLPLLSQDTLYLEQEYFKLAAINAWLGQTEREEKILSQLVDQQQKNPEWHWTLKNRTLLAFGNAQEKNGHLEAAQQAFKQAETSADPSVMHAAQLHLARIQALQLPLEERSMESDKALAILKSYQNLQIKKTLKTEPVHLEAALDLASFRASLDPADTREELWLGLLHKAKEDFTTREDLCSQDYHEAMQELPAKAALYQAYMILVDAHIAQLEARKLLREEKIEDAETQRELAKSLYQYFLEPSQTSTDYLVHEAQLGLDSIQNTDNIPLQEPS